MGAYATYLQTPHWKKVSSEAKERAGNRCQVCGSTIALDVHHSNYLSFWHEDPQDVVCLCHKCHEIYHFTDIEFTDEPLEPVQIFWGRSDSAWGIE
jgi:5-methylcytosine-specific restriction endonuclease McrA